MSSTDPNEPKYNMVNGELVELTKAEIAEIKRERKAALKRAEEEGDAPGRSDGD